MEELTIDHMTIVHPHVKHLYMISKLTITNYPLDKLLVRRKLLKTLCMGGGLLTINGSESLCLTKKLLTCKPSQFELADEPATRALDAIKEFHKEDNIGEKCERTRDKIGKLRLLCLNINFISFFLHPVNAVGALAHQLFEIESIYI
ncbi:9588_t:CDS:2 [Funneliformis geosporum]|uniref:9588_t:CDS:1 n=1 Tax=Funneliformis geosporum TaxID=1117311 RepID=A0A9W4SK63_9GLOM|nr:9588_t:CDS:2 [Funneliformis geosporum]